jgi:hypothetical protein
LNLIGARLVGSRMKSCSLVTIRRPDTRQPEKDTGDHPAIVSFAEIMPS